MSHSSSPLDGTDGQTPPASPTAGPTDDFGPVATPVRVAVASVPSVLLVLTPFFPFAKRDSMIAGLPTVFWWVAVMILLTVLLLQILDRHIKRQQRDFYAARDAARPAGGGR